MPFLADELVARFRACHDARRLGHAYLLTGDRPAVLADLAGRLAEIILQAPAAQHPDFHAVRPESRSRRITIAQVRELERVLYLKPFKAPQKVAYIADADRMCLGAAEAANAFLKTLEEPPEATVLLLGTTRPDVVLPTIRSRCLRLDLLVLPGGDPEHESPEVRRLVESWFRLERPGPLRGYERASLLQRCWSALKAGLDEDPEDDAAESEEVAKAALEAEFQLARQESIGSLLRQYWDRCRPGQRCGSPRPVEALRAIRALEQLQASLQFNVDASLAVERACLAIEKPF